MNCYALWCGGLMRAAVERVRKLSGTMAGCALAAGAGWLLRSPVPRVPRWALWCAAALGCALTANELSGKPVPFLRWTFLRLAMRSKHLATEWQVGDGREAALAGQSCPRMPRRRERRRPGRRWLLPPLQLPHQRGRREGCDLGRGRPSRAATSPARAGHLLWLQRPSDGSRDAVGSAAVLDRVQPGECRDRATNPGPRWRRPPGDRHRRDLGRQRGDAAQAPRRARLRRGLTRLRLPRP